jgi:DNA/RNA-binding domain of Phe-tRNA-synthetase-like protein
MPSYRFRYEAAITEQFPVVQGGVIHAIGLVNGPSPDALVSRFEAEQAAVRARLEAASLSELPSLAAWRRAFRAFGVDPTGYRSAAEALLRRLTKQGSIPSISTLVDIGNLVSIRYALPVAVFDQRSVTGGTTVRPATGTETFTDLGSGDQQAPVPGEVIFVDESGLVSARRWCWRQSAESASGADTTELLVATEAQHEGGAETVASALRDIEDLLQEFARPKALASGVVSAHSPSFAGLDG